MVSSTSYLVAVVVYSVLAGVRTAIVPPGLHPVAADGHRAPPRGVGLAPVDQEQPALGVRTWPKAPWTRYPQGIPRQHRPDRARRYVARLDPPIQSVRSRDRPQRDPGEELLESSRPRLTAHHLVQHRPDFDERRRLRLRRSDPAFAHPAPRRLPDPPARHEPFRRRRASCSADRAGMPHRRRPLPTSSISNPQITIDRLHDRELTIANH